MVWRCFKVGMVEWYGGASRLGWLNGMEVLQGWDG